MANHSVMRAHAWLLEAAEGETERLVDGKTEFTLTKEYLTLSLPRVLSLMDQVNKWQQQDFGGVEITSLSLQPPSESDKGAYGNYGELKPKMLWEPNSKATTTLTIKAQVKGKLSLEGLGETLRLGFAGAVKRALANKLEATFPLPKELMLLPFTADALFVGVPAQLNQCSFARFEKDYLVSNSLTKVDSELLQLGYVIHTQKEFMVITAVWKRPANNWERESVARRLQGDFPSKTLEAHFLVW